MNSPPPKTAHHQPMMQPASWEWLGWATVEKYPTENPRREVTSFGTFLSTLCHQFCHRLDLRKLGFVDSRHTRGFYERAAVLYHYARGTPLKILFWVPVAGGRWRIDWQRTNRGA